MDIVNSIGLLFGSGWASGMNLYMTVAILGIAQRLHWISLPGNMTIVSNPLIILIAVLMYLVEFVADKIPYFDSIWDSIHTFIRPVGGAALGFMAAANAGPVLQTAATLLSGALAADSHLTKATVRVAINTSPEPVTNSIASVTEDISVAGMLYLVIKHPIIATIVVVLFVFISIWLLRKLFRFLKKVFSFLFRGSGAKSAKSGVKGS